MSLEGSYIALAKPPLPAFLECWQYIAPRKLIDRVGAEVEEESDLARVQKDVVLISHHGQDEGLQFGTPHLFSDLHYLKPPLSWQILAASATLAEG